MGDETAGEQQRPPSPMYPFKFPLDPSLVKYQLDDNDDISEVKAVLTGVSTQYDKEKKAWVQLKIGKPLMNDEGVRLIIDTLFRSISSKNIKLTNLNIQDTYMLARMSLCEVSRMLFTNMDTFGIKDLATLSTIMEILRSNIMAVYKRAFGEGERKFIKGYVEEKIVQPQRGGMNLLGG